MSMIDSKISDVVSQMEEHRVSAGQASAYKALRTRLQGRLRNSDELVNTARVLRDVSESQILLFRDLIRKKATIEKL